MKIITIILLILLGVILLLIEFLLIPGISIAGIGCLIAFALSVVFAFRYFGSMVGLIVLVSILILVPLFLYFLFKGKAMKPMMLNTGIDGKVKNVEEGQLQVGDEGVTIGRLAPAGKARIKGITLEVRSNGQYVDQQTKIKVLKIEGNTVYVEPINE